MCVLSFPVFFQGGEEGIWVCNFLFSLSLHFSELGQLTLSFTVGEKLLNQLKNYRDKPVYH